MASPKGIMSPEAKNLNPPKNDPISLDELSKCNGVDSNRPTLVAIKGVVFDVSSNAAYKQGGNYNVFAGKDASRALACSSLKVQDCRPEWQDLGEKEKGVLEDWFKFFSKRYNIIGKVAGASNF